MMTTLWATLALSAAAAPADLDPTTDEAPERPEAVDILPVADAQWDAEIVYGPVEEGYPNAVSLVLGPMSFCTGSLITPKVVLTAAHCVIDFPEDVFTQFGKVNVGTDSANPDFALDIAQVIPHEEYKPIGATRDGTPRNDMAVLVLAENAPVEPIWFNTRELTDADLGLEMTSVGFGVQENGRADGLKHSGTLTLDSLETQFTVSLSSTNRRNQNVCSGDSGGPQYAEIDGELLQIAVHSWADQNCTFMSGSTRTDLFTGWIEQRILDVHGTLDECAFSGRYGDGVCDPGCEQVDVDCITAFEAEGGGDSESAGGCGCNSANLGALWLGPLLLLGLRRRR